MVHASSMCTKVAHDRIIAAQRNQSETIVVRGRTLEPLPCDGDDKQNIWSTGFPLRWNAKSIPDHPHPIPLSSIHPHTRTSTQVVTQ